MIFSLAWILKNDGANGSGWSSSGSKRAVLSGISKWKETNGGNHENI